MKKAKPVKKLKRKTILSAKVRLMKFNAILSATMNTIMAADLTLNLDDAVGYWTQKINKCEDLNDLVKIIKPCLDGGRYFIDDPSFYRDSVESFARYIITKEIINVLQRNYDFGNGNISKVLQGIQASKNGVDELLDTIRRKIRQNYEQILKDNVNGFVNKKPSASAAKPEEEDYEAIMMNLAGNITKKPDWYKALLTRKPARYDSWIHFDVSDKFYPISKELAIRTFMVYYVNVALLSWINKGKEGSAITSEDQIKPYLEKLVKEAKKPEEQLDIINQLISNTLIRKTAEVIASAKKLVETKPNH